MTDKDAAIMTVAVRLNLQCQKMSMLPESKLRDDIQATLALLADTLVIAAKLEQ